MSVLVLGYLTISPLIHSSKFLCNFPHGLYRCSGVDKMTQPKQGGQQKYNCIPVNEVYMYGGMLGSKKIPYEWQQRNGQKHVGAVLLPQVFLFKKANCNKKANQCHCQQDKEYALRQQQLDVHPDS